MASCARTQKQIRFIYNKVPVRPVDPVLPKGIDDIMNEVRKHVFSPASENGIRCTSCHGVLQRTEAVAWGSA